MFIRSRSPHKAFRFVLQRVDTDIKWLISKSIFLSRRYRRSVPVDNGVVRYDFIVSITIGRNPVSFWVFS